MRPPYLHDLVPRHCYGDGSKLGEVCARGSCGSWRRGGAPILSGNSMELLLTVVVRTNNPELTISGVHAGDLRAVSWSPLPESPEGESSNWTDDVPPGCQRRLFRLPITEHFKTG